MHDQGSERKKATNKQEVMLQITFSRLSAAAAPLGFFVFSLLHVLALFRWMDTAGGKKVPTAGIKVLNIHKDVCEFMGKEVILVFVLL